MAAVDELPSDTDIFLEKENEPRRLRAGRGAAPAIDSCRSPHCCRPFGARPNLANEVSRAIPVLYVAEDRAGDGCACYAGGLCP
jgi:hypothetical protein